MVPRPITVPGAITGPIRSQREHDSRSSSAGAGPGNPPTIAIADDDVVLPFQVDPYALRGRVVRLGAAVDTILSRHDYPRQVARSLAELVALAAATCSSCTAFTSPLLSPTTTPLLPYQPTIGLLGWAN